MTKGFRHFENAADYQFGCPEGTWTAQLDHKAWGQSRNLILYFSDVNTGKKHWFSVFHANDYKPQDMSLSFRDGAEAGDIFELKTAKTKKGGPKLSTARKIDANTSVPVMRDNQPLDGLAIVDEDGNVHPLTPELVGDTRENMRKKLADLDISELPTIDEARAMQRARRDRGLKKHQP